MRRRLFVQIYLGFVAVALLSLLSAGLAARLLSDREAIPPALRLGAAMLVEGLPDPERAPAAFKQALAERARRLGLHVSVFTADGRLLGRVGDRMPRPPAACDDPWIHSNKGAPGLCFQLPDGRWVAGATDRPGHSHWLVRFSGMLGAIALAIAAGSYPLARRITRRLELLQRGVEAWGEGELTRRVSIEGADEVADLARSFNASAERVTELVEGQRRVLAHASHELRSPLARLRMALALLEDAEGDDKNEALREAEREVRELDALIEDVLLASRLKGGVTVPREMEVVDLVALAREVAEEMGVPRSAKPATLQVQGDVRLLRRALRNLVENARRHGAEPIELHLDQQREMAELSVLDRGPGIPDELQQRIFEPFFRPPGHSEADGGLGLGLALVAEIARHHGGEVRYSTREGGGSCFSLRLPLAC